MASILAPLHPAGRGCVNIGSTNGRDAYTVNSLLPLLPTWKNPDKFAKCDRSHA
jgi:hypothetical protein